MGNIWGIHRLIPHPHMPPRTVEEVTVQLSPVSGAGIFVEWAVYPSPEMALPPRQAPARTDGLWKTTCFETFAKAKGSEAYLEFNFAPSFAWAAYGFDRYREGMRPLPQERDPDIAISLNPPWFWLSAEFEPTVSGVRPIVANFAAVIEETDGTKSYWALAHPPSGPPDFHHPDCFVLELPPAPRP